MGASPSGEQGSLTSVNASCHTCFGGSKLHPLPQRLVPVSGAGWFRGHIPAESPSARRPSPCRTAGRSRWACRAVPGLACKVARSGLVTPKLSGRPVWPVRRRGVRVAEWATGPDLPERVLLVRAALPDADRARFEQELD